MVIAVGQSALGTQQQHTRSELRGGRRRRRHPLERRERQGARREVAIAYELEALVKHLMEGARSSGAVTVSAEGPSRDAMAARLTIAQACGVAHLHAPKAIGV